MGIYWSHPPKYTLNQLATREYSANAIQYGITDQSSVSIDSIVEKKYADQF